MSFWTNRNHRCLPLSHPAKPCNDYSAQRDKLPTARGFPSIRASPRSKNSRTRESKVKRLGKRSPSSNSSAAAGVATVNPLDASQLNEGTTLSSNRNHNEQTRGYKCIADCGSTAPKYLCDLCTNLNPNGIDPSEQSGMMHTRYI